MYIYIYIFTHVHVYRISIFDGGNIGKVVAIVCREPSRKVRKTVRANYKNRKVIGCEKHEIRTANPKKNRAF